MDNMLVTEYTKEDRDIFYTFDSGKYTECGYGRVVNNTIQSNRVTWWDYNEETWKEFLTFCQTGEYPDA